MSGYGIVATYVKEAVVKRDEKRTRIKTYNKEQNLNAHVVVLMCKRDADAHWHDYHQIEWLSTA